MLFIFLLTSFTTWCVDLFKVSGSILLKLCREFIPGQSIAKLSLEILHDNALYKFNIDVDIDIYPHF